MFTLTEKIVNNNIIFNSKEVISAITHDFFQQHSLTHFSYGRIYNTPHQFTLTNEPEVVIDYLQHGFYRNVEYNSLITYLNKPVFIPWQSGAKSDLEISRFVKEKHNLNNGISILIPQIDFLEAYFFSSSKEAPSLCHFYDENHDVLLTFCHEFRIKAKDLIAKAHEQRIHLPDLKIHKITPYYENLLLGQEDTHYKQIKQTFHETAGLTHREYQTLYYLAHGYSAKTIANTLNLTPRTIRFYLENVKEKLAIYSKDELARYYWYNINQ